MSITKVAQGGAKIAQPGRIVTYEIVVSNFSPSTAATDVVVDDFLPNGQAILDIRPDKAWDCSHDPTNAVLTCGFKGPFPTVGPAGPLRFTVAYTVLVHAGRPLGVDMVNTATVTSSEVDGRLSNNTATVALHGNGKASCTAFATAKNAPLVGTPESDVLCTAGQKSQANGLAGNDTLYVAGKKARGHGGEGDDELFAYGKGVKLFGDGGDDTLVGEAEKGVLDGGDGTDTCTVVGDGKYKIKNCEIVT